MRRLLLVALVAGCGIDEGGLLATNDGAPNDVSVPDVSVADVMTNDVTADVEPSDAGVDVAQDDVVVVDAAPEATVDAGPILEITGGTYTLLDPDAGVCSLNANNAASFQLVNDHGAPVDLVWVNYQCAEQAYGTIAANGQKSQNTYETHVWRVRNDSDKSLLGGFRLDSANAFTVTVH